MRDIIWTIIVIWLVFRIVSLFRYAGRNAGQHAAAGSPASDLNPARPQKDLQSAMRRRMNQEGEYVDFEEVK